VGAGDVQVHRGGPAPGARAGQVLGQPVEGLVGGDRGPLGQHLGVRPRTKQQRDVHAPAVQVRVLLQRLLEEQVLPAAEQQYRHLHPVQCGWSPACCETQSRYHGAPPASTRSPASTRGAPASAGASRRPARACRTRPDTTLPSSWWATMSLQPRKSLSLNEPPPCTFSHMSWGPTITSAQASSGGGSVISAHCVKPR